MVFGISNTPSIQPEQVEDYIENGHQLIDVREDDEWQAGHHLNANHIKMGEIPSSLDKFDKEKKYIKKWVNFNSSDYPVEIVNHKIARQRCLDTYKRYLD